MLQGAGVERGARVLDAGAGKGRTVAALRAAGYDATGIEPSQRGLDAASAAGRPVVRGELETHSDSALDAVVLWHVLEHIGSPGAALSRTREWLGNEGVVVVAVPNLASWQARLGGRSWMHFDVPRHRVHFTVAGLHALLRRSGFEPLRTSHFVWDQNPVGMWTAMLSAWLRLPPGYPFLLLKRAAPASPALLARLALGLPLAPAALLAETAAGATRRGGTIACIARHR
jgi:SAM-dependent methyltransferase